MTTPSAFTLKLLQARAVVGTIRKDKINPRFHSTYASLDSILAAVVPALAAQQLVLTQAVNAGDTRDVVVTRITDGETSVEACTPICADRTDPQKFGSAVTYARRYGLSSLLALAVDEDDDGNSAAAARPAAPPRDTPPATEAAQGVVHFGKNKGVPLTDLPDGSLRWYANEWEPNDSAGAGAHARDLDLKEQARLVLEQRKAAT